MTNALDETSERPGPAVGVAGGEWSDRVASRAADSASVLLLVGLGACLLGQGGYVGWLRWPVGLLVLAAAALAVRGGQAVADVLRCPPVRAAGLLAVWAVAGADGLQSTVRAGLTTAAPANVHWRGSRGESPLSQGPWPVLGVPDDASTD